MALLLAGGSIALAKKGGVPTGKGLGVAGAPGQQTADGGSTDGGAEAPTNYIAQSSTLSQPIYETTTTSETFTTFDGEELYLEITRPDPAKHGDGPWPVIFEASPYHGTIATRIGDRIFPDPKNGNQNLGLTGYFGPRGYAVVMMDLRGTGRSTGCLDHLGPNDAKDMKLLIEDLAKRPWSNGRIGMTGHSYVGSTPTVAAAARPKGLVTIAPSAGLASMYDHQFQMGVPYNLQWVGPMAAYEGLALVRDLPPGFTEPVLTGAPTGDNWANGPNPEIGCGMQNSAALAGSGQATGQYELWHAKRDWRTLAADVDIPVFMIHGVNDNAARIPAAEWFFANRFNRPGDKVWLGQWDHGSTNGRCGNVNNQRVSHPTCRFSQWQYALHAWFDKHLAQRDVNTGPPVEVFLNGELGVNVSQVMDPETVGGKVYTADGWSRPDVRRELYLDASNQTLSFTPPAANASRNFTTTAEGVAASVGSGKLTFVGQPVEEDTLFLGLNRLQLNAAVTSEITHLTIQLFRVDDEGNREVMNTCAIQPQLRSGIHTIDPVVPLQEMELRPQCFTMAHWLQAGDRLEVEVGTRTSHHASFASSGQITVFTGPGKSHYLLPEISEFTLFNDVPLRESA
jgi:putative CocE/NonD family hydrolase